MSKNKKIRMGIVDTTFARVDMAKYALDELRKYEDEITIIRRTVPGIKDLAVECKRLLEIEKCDACLALGMVGSAPIDAQCAHEASLGIMWAKLMANKHIVEAFVHECEAGTPAELVEICESRARKHAVNAVMLARQNYESLQKNAGRGIRQGKPDAGPLQV